MQSQESTQEEKSMSSPQAASHQISHLSAPHPPQKAVAEFKKWKKALMDMIRTESRLISVGENGWQFMLPPRLVRLVYETSIRETVKALRLKRPELEEPTARAEALQTISLKLREAALLMTDAETQAPASRTDDAQEIKGVEDK